MDPTFLKENINGNQILRNLPEAWTNIKMDHMSYNSHDTMCKKRKGGYFWT